MDGGFVCYTLLYARNPHDSNRWFRIQVETRDDMAKLFFQHLRPNDHIDISGHLESYFKVSSNGNPKSSYMKKRLEAASY
ncbi:PREDICTED: protein OSB1, mitochondrial-like [Populus euphratica]|uniref:Protein OSB1, mitochondrial-like n=1 Tax=Populus euphratica TaxID=75702 RepID=A0AAJ6XFY8_POPEU|nr:PREDICTED: protein OSB1, mitochondrial-like [Populus euphratica]